MEKTFFTNLLALLLVLSGDARGIETNGAVIRIFGGFVTIPSEFYLQIDNYQNLYHYYLKPTEGSSRAEDNAQIIQVGPIEALLDPLGSPLGWELRESFKEKSLHIEIYAFSKTSPHINSDYGKNTRTIVIKDANYFLSIFDLYNSELWRTILRSYKRDDRIESNVEHSNNTPESFALLTGTVNPLRGLSAPQLKRYAS